MPDFNVLVVGSGGREHALAWALSRSPQVRQVYLAPGNAGTEWPLYTASTRLQPLAPSSNVPIAAEDIWSLLTFAQENEIPLTVVGPETPLAAGIVDAFQAAGLRIFGPTRAAAQLEASKAFAKAFMQEHGIPTGQYATFDDYEEARDYLSHHSGAIVVKADGLAAGKGVIVCQDSAEAEDALYRTMVAREFGPAGSTVLLEECLIGPEVSLMAFCDGRTAVPMLPARDHKRVLDGDQGPNTGGMGAFAPAPDVIPALVEEIRRSVLQAAVDGMAARGTPYVGVLYAGLMLTENGPKVLEFNCRFGDPETQVVLPLLESDLLDVMLACIEGRLDTLELRWKQGACATVVLTSPGYPGQYPKGLVISGLEQANHESTMVFHAGTACKDGHFVTAGGRVVAVSGLDSDLSGALRRAYHAIEHVYFEGMHYRRDIGNG